MEMSKNLSDALFSLQDSLLSRGMGRRERRPPKPSSCLDAPSVVEFLDGESGLGHRAHSHCQFVARDDVSLTAHLKGRSRLRGRLSDAGVQQ